MLFIFDHLTSHGEEMLKFSTIMFLFTHICFFFLRFIIILFEVIRAFESGLIIFDLLQECFAQLFNA